MITSFRETRNIEILTLSDATINDMNDFIHGTRWVISLDPENFVNHYDALMGVLRESDTSPFSSSAIPLTRQKHIVKINSVIVGVYDDKEIEEIFLN